MKVVSAVYGISESSFFNLCIFLLHSGAVLTLQKQ